MVTNKFTGSVLMDGNEDDLFKVFGTTLKHFASYVYLKALQVGDSIRIRVYDKVDDVSRYKLDGDVNDSVGSNNGTITNISSWVSQWKFDGNVNDSIGTNNGTITYHTNLKQLMKFEGNVNATVGNNGTVVGNTNFATGKEGQAFIFDGSTDITSADTGFPSGNSAFSVSFWIKPNAVNTQQLLSLWGTQSNGDAMIIAIDETSAGTIDVDVYGGSILHSNTLISAGVWSHVVVTSDGTTTKIYINGVLDANSTTHTWNIVLSGLRLSGYSGGANYTGLMDEYRVYNIALTQAQVSSLYMNGKFAQSHTFDNTDNTATGEFITISNNTSLNPTGGVSISGWFKGQSGTLEQDLFRKDDQYAVRVDANSEASNRLSFFVWTSNGGGTLHDRLSWVFTPNVWNHFCATYNGSTGNWSLYGNGILISNATVVGTTTLNTTTNSLFVGSINSAPLGVFAGQLDEFRIYNTELSASQVLGLYNYTGSNFVSPLPQGNSILFNGSTYIAIPNYTPYNFERTNTWSASFWVKSTSTGTQRLFTNYSGSVGYILSLVNGGSSGDAFQIEMYGASNNLIAKIDNLTIRDGNWHNLIFTYSGNSNTSGVNMYLDGVLKSLTTVSNTLASSILANDTVYIATRDAGTETYSGLLDEVQIYNYVLSSAEIFNLNAGRFGNTHPIGLWHFDGDLYDYSGQGSTGIPTGTIEYVTGALSGSYTVPNEHFNFDGSEYITCGNPTNLPINNSDRSVAFWIQPINFVNGNVIYTWGSTSTDDDFFLQFTGTSGNILASGFGDDLTSTGTLTLNQWNFVVVTLSNFVLTIYINGIASGSKTTGIINTTNTSIYIGSSNAGLSNLVGHLDDFRIYTRGLSAGEVLDLFNYPDSPMKELIYDRTYSGVVPDAKYIPMLQGNQYKVTCQQILGTNRIIPWERWEVT